MKPALQNKRALVTGGSRGIGAAIVRRLASEGAHVALTYVSKPDEANKTAAAAKAFGVKTLTIQADSASPEAVAAAVERTVQEFGGIDILVNSAGVLAIGPIDDLSLKDFDRTVAVNIRAVFIATQAAVKHMKEGGRIINIGSCNDMNPAHGDFAEMLKKLMALPRYANADEIAAMVAYLAGPEAGFVTGASLTIDGGFTA